MTIRQHSVNLIYSFLKTLSKLHSPWSRKKTSAKVYRDIQSCIKPGHVLLSTRYGDLANLVIPGKYKHAAIYSGNGNVIEAVTHGGVIETDLIDFIMSKDRVCVLDPKTDNFIKEKAVNIAEKHLGEGYDFSFLIKNKLSYCSELVWLSYAVLGFKLSDLKLRLGRESILAQDFRDSEKVNVIYEFLGNK